MAGDCWKSERYLSIEAADIVLLLVSPDFIASDYCYDVEMARAIERHLLNEVRVIPIIVREVSWTHAPFSNLQALPTDGVALARRTKGSRDPAWRGVEEKIRESILQLKSI
jgi:hypothetical protein